MSIRNFSITFLGTSAVSISPHTATSAYLVETDRSRILIDAGVGALRQLRRVRVSPDGIDIILITHWHLDHYAGLPSVLRARRKNVARFILGPAIPFSARLFLALSFRPLGQAYVTITGDFSRSYGDFSIQAVPNSHFFDSCGWVILGPSEGISEDQRKIVLSGDTRPDEGVLNAARGADLLVHEATYLERNIRTAIANQHSTAAEAAELARKAAVGSLALTHLPDRYSKKEIQAEAQKIFIRTFIPSPLDKVHIEPLPAGEAKINPGWAKIRVEAG